MELMEFPSRLVGKEYVEMEYSFAMVDVPLPCWSLEQTTVGIPLGAVGTKKPHQAGLMWDPYFSDIECTVFSIPRE